MKFETANIPEFEETQVSLPEASFLSYKPNFDLAKRMWSEYGHFKNLLIIGHGGSILSFKGIFSVLGNRNISGHKHPNPKNVYFLSTTDPEYITELKHGLDKTSTLVIAISKSGETVTQIEALLQFLDFPLLGITSEDSVLGQIIKKKKGKVVTHSNIGGRFSAFAEPGLVPAAIAGIDVKSFYAGAKEFYAQYENKGNIAYKTAQILFTLENKGYTDVFLSFYSHALFRFAGMEVQLMHESTGKNGKGQTFFAEESPESQHATNQRLLAGRKNVVAFFQSPTKFRNELITQVPTELHSIPLKDESLFTLNHIPLSYSMESEFQGTFADAKIQSIPVIALEMDMADPEETGRLIAFWQMLAVYSATLRGVNPFDQPAVENSKKISWNQRKNFRYQ